MQEREEINLKDLDLNAQFHRVYDLVENTRDNVFVTGKAGTGKSTFLQYFCRNTKKKNVVLAPTGVAAINVGGQTIHSFFNFKPDTTVDMVSEIRLSRNKQKILQEVEVIIIDEISMVRADLLDCIDAALRLHGGNSKKACAGIQMIFIGDLFQLPPVVRTKEQSIFQSVYQSPYFFEAKVFRELAMQFVELDQNYRQQDQAFLEVLNKIRNNSINTEELRFLNSRYDPQLKSAAKDFYIYLTTTNELADNINDARLQAIDEESFRFEGEIAGDFEQKNLPTRQDLELKVGAQVMLLNNDQARRWINGSIGKVIAVDEHDGAETTIRVELTDGNRVDVGLFTWELFQFFYDEETQKIDTELIGSFRQYPLKLAWAVTIHKSQGKTFDKVIIDLGRGTFSHGQTYVALSRCTSLEGILLKRPISKRDIILDSRVQDFIQNYQYEMAERFFPLEAKKNLIREAIEQRQTLEIVYLKEKGEKHTRRIIPKDFRFVDYEGQKCLGVEAFCLERQTDWIFRLGCIVEIHVTSSTPEVGKVQSQQEINL